MVLTVYHTRLNASKRKSLSSYLLNHHIHSHKYMKKTHTFHACPIYKNK